MTQPGNSGNLFSVVTRRLVDAAAILSVTLICVFTITRLMPGDPVSLMMSGSGVDPEFVRHIREGAGFEQPLWRQFASYVTSLFRGDFGVSWRYGGMPVASLVLEAAPVTLLLAVAALLVAGPVGVAAGVVSAHRSRRWLDCAITVSSVLALCAPPIVLATLSMLSIGVPSNSADRFGWRDLASLAAPVVTLAIPSSAMIARSTRAQLLDVLGQDYVRFARAKGLTDAAVLWRHALPNALIPVSAVVGTIAGALVTSTAVVEIVFNLPGLGRLAVFSVLARDYPLASAIMLIFVLAQITISLVVDLVIIAIDPRCRSRGSGA